MSTLAEVLAAHQWDTGRLCKCGVRLLTRPEMFDHQAEAITAEGLVCVAVPERSGLNGNDNRVWLHGPYIEQEFNGDVIISDRLAINADELRPVAAALLAAANAAERVQS